MVFLENVNKIKIFRTVLFCFFLACLAYCCFAYYIHNIKDSPSGHHIKMIRYELDYFLRDQSNPLPKNVIELKKLLQNSKNNKYKRIPAYAKYVHSVEDYTNPEIYDLENVKVKNCSNKILYYYSIQSKTARLYSCFDDKVSYGDIPITR